MVPPTKTGHRYFFTFLDSKSGQCQAFIDETKKKSTINSNSSIKFQGDEMGKVTL